MQLFLITIHIRKGVRSSIFYPIKVNMFLQKFSRLLPSTGGNCVPQGTSAMPGGTFAVTAGGAGATGLVGRGQGCCSTSCTAKNFLAPMSTEPRLRNPTLTYTLFPQTCPVWGQFQLLKSFFSN